MSNDGVNSSRRRFLTTATAVVGGIGGVFAAVPFLASMQPSERAKAIGAPIEMDISKLEPGQMMIGKWRGKPIWVVRRDEDILAHLNKDTEDLRDPHSEVAQQPDYAKNDYRSIKPEYLVLIGICTHLGCSPKFFPPGAPNDLGPDWYAGFFCPCHGSRFDLAGRVHKGVPAPTNLVVPPYHYVSDTIIQIGVDKGAA